jgi:short-subunit dehydrogenase
VSVKWQLEGGVAVITGAGSGIGQALAKSLAREKMALALGDVDAAGLAETANSVASTGVRVSTHQVDVGNSYRMCQFAGEVLEHHGRASLLINNAGVALLGRFEELALEEMEWLMRINFWGVVHGVKSFLPILRREQRAHIVNVSSILGIIAPAGDSAYCASKFAIRGLTEVLAQELKDTAVRVSCVHPGKIRTPFSKRARVAAAATERLSGRGQAEVAGQKRIMSAEMAARRILQGVKKQHSRILVGADAVWADRLQRIFPASYQKVIWSLTKLRP